MTPEERIKELVSQVSQRRIIENGLRKKLRYMTARNMILEECLREVYTYANTGIKERHGDEEFIAKDLKNMFFKAVKKVDELRQEEEWKFKE